MFLIIQDNNKIVQVSFFELFDYKGIHIYRKNNNYYINLDTGLFFLDNSKIKLLEVGKYTIKSNKVFYHINLYVYENSKGISDYKLYEIVNFLIAHNRKANIVSYDPYLKDYYLLYKNNKLESNFNIILNHHKYDGRELSNGDVIEFLGIKIIYFTSFIYMNSFNIDIKLKQHNIKPQIIRYPNNTLENKHYLNKRYINLDIPELVKFDKPIENNHDFIRSFIPNFISCLSCLLMVIINYLNSENTNILSTILTPITMILVSIVVPSIFEIINKYKYKTLLSKKIDDYTIYLNNYYDELQNNIEQYLDNQNRMYFDISKNKDMFSVNYNSYEYMKLWIGKNTLNNNLVLDRYSIPKIDNELDKIEELANNIKDNPVYIDLYKNRIVTIITSVIDSNYYFNYFFLQIVYKYNFNDIHIAIYTKDNSIIDDKYNIPHLFINNSRNTFNSIEELLYLDQLKLDKPLILFILDKCDYTFKNENIYVLYFADDINDTYCNSSIIVEYLNNGGYIYLQDKKEFKYTRLDIDYKYYYSLVGNYCKINNETKNAISFKDVFSDDIETNYLNNIGLQARFSCHNNEIIDFDLHESKCGPHGLIGGSTGSGKSELIVSLLLSLCIRYSCEYLNIVLIDYKGGGIKESLTYNGKTLPHIIAAISNLEDNVMQRLIIALENECIKRQLLFKKLSNMLSISIMNIDDYLNNYDESLEKLAHLLIVVDEFAELKKQNNEYIKKLISISRIGRSLGVHLILATQKPQGIIDDEIWSNSRFKIALKVFDEKDSLDLIKCKDAAYINEPGSFILKVDNNTLSGKAIYSKGDIYGKGNNSVSILSNTLSMLSTYNKNNNNTLSYCNYYCKKIIDTCYKMKLKTNNLKYLPESNINNNSYLKTNKIFFGLIDDYYNNIYEPLYFDINDSMLIYSSRPKQINNILNNLDNSSMHTIVISDKEYKGRCISDCINYDSYDDIQYLFKVLEHNENHICIVIEDIDCFLSYSELYLDNLLKLIKRKDALNISFIILCKNAQLNYKLKNIFDKKIMIEVLDENDVGSFYFNRSRYLGKSFYFDLEVKSFIASNIDEYINRDCVLPRLIKRIPNYISSDIKDNEYLIGYDLYTRDPIYTNNIEVVSNNKKLLDIYQKAYNLKTNIYSYDYKTTNNILWLGEGIFNQRLFVPSNSKDINNNEGILIIDNEKKYIRRINDESEINEI